MSNKTYDILKYIQRIALPAVVVLLGAIGKAIGWDATITVAIISAVDVFLGSLLQVNYNSYVKTQENKEE